MPETPYVIRCGAEYEYVYVGWRADRRGYRYRAERFVLAVPSYQRQVLVVGLDGPDAGRSFVCSLANFAISYEPAPQALTAAEPPTEKSAGYLSESWRTCT